MNVKELKKIVDDMPDDLNIEFVTSSGEMSGDINIKFAHRKLFNLAEDLLIISAKGIV